MTTLCNSIVESLSLWCKIEVDRYSSFADLDHEVSVSI